MAIIGTHMLLYTSEPDAVRAIFRDVFGWKHVDDGGGWLIFKLPPAEVAVHPTDGPPSHELYLMCDGIDDLLAELAAKGVEISKPVSDQGWGRLAAVRLPSGADLPLYEPRHPVAHSLED